MNKRECFKVMAVTLLAAGLMIQLTGCASSTPQGRVQQNPQMFEQLPAADRDLVMRGTISEGMSRDAVFLAWGKPDVVTTGSEGGRQIETWRYAQMHPVYPYGYGVGLGYGPGYYRHGGLYPYGTVGLTPGYVPVTASVVRFRNGRVVSWELRR
jgi:hypothetical protein